MKKTILLLLLIPTTFLAMDPSEKILVSYNWQQHRKSSPESIWSFSQATLADFKQAIASKKNTNQFALNICFNTNEINPSPALLKRLTSHFSAWKLSASSTHCNLVEIACPETTTLKTLIDAGEQTPNDIISTVIFVAIVE